MPELSNLIRQRLGAAKAPGTHPDADLISAYGEGRLPSSERAQLTSHLAVCADCRELLALSLPEQTIAPIGATAVAKSSQPLGSYLRVAASLAAVLVAVVLLLTRPHHQPVAQTESAQSTLAQTAPPSAPPEIKEAAPRDSSENVTAVVSAEGHTAKSPARRMATVRQAQPAQQANLSEVTESAQSIEVTASARPIETARAVSHDYVNSQVLANQLFLTDKARQGSSLQDLPSAPSPASTTEQKNMFVAGGAIAGNSFAGIPMGSSQKAQSSGAVSIFHDSSHRGLSISSTISRVGSELHLKRPLAPISSQNANAYAMFKPGISASADAEVAANRDKAETLKQSPAFTGLGMAAHATPQSQMFLWRIMEGKLLKSSDMSNWAEGYPASEGIEFTVVRSAGSEVWAGGNNAALVHSSDSGITWRRVVLGAAATGAISSIEISRNAMNIQVTSSSGQSWASQDGGKTWMMVN